MMIRKLETWQELLEADRLIATAFLHPWDEEKAKQERMEEAESGQAPKDLIWGAFGGAGQMISAVNTIRNRVSFEGRVIRAGEMHMVGSLPEARGHGTIREMMYTIFHEFKDRGDLFAMLIPFSCAFYRKFGFELATESLKLKADVSQLAGFRETLTARQLVSPDMLPAVRALYEDFVLRHNLNVLREEKDWTWRGNGEFGVPDWFFGDKQRYTYVFYDTQGQAHAYMTFVFVHGPEGPFTGTMEITDIAFDGPKALKSVLGFIYGMRAKITGFSLELPPDMDLNRLLPEGHESKRTVGGHVMYRALHIPGILSARRYPREAGTFTIRVTDAFLPENTGTYAVAFADGKAVSVTMTEQPADLEVTEESFVQLVTRHSDLDDILYRDGSKLLDNGILLSMVFAKKFPA